jgi:leader peptidase (prepilin peptidase)/N-methyltransferase
LWLSDAWHDDGQGRAIRGPRGRPTTAALVLAGCVPLIWWWLTSAAPPGEALAERLPLLAFVPFALAAGLVDLRIHLLPRQVLWAGGVTVAALIALSTWEDIEPHRLGSTLVVTGLAGGCAALLAHRRPAGFGFGDVRLTVLIALVCAWVSPAVAAAAFLVGGLLGIASGVVAEARGSATFPFGPPLIAGALVTLALRSPLLTFVGA